MDAAYHLLITWACQDQGVHKQAEAINAHFRDRETEFETGVPVLPGWAAIGDVASRYGVDDGASPFDVAEPVEDESSV